MSPGRELRVILIGGTSHTGKTALARALAARLGWRRLSTDSLARHPGRPWKTGGCVVPDHVAEHYLSLSVDELIEDVLAHYRSLWPAIRDLVSAHATDPSGYAAHVTDHLRAAFAPAADDAPIIDARGQRSIDSPDRADMPDPASTAED